MNRSSGRRTSRLARFLAVCAALALLASAGLTAFLDRTLPAVGKSAAGARRGLVILFADSQAPRRGDRLLSAGLAEHGIGLAILAGPSVDAGTAAAVVAHEIARLQAESGLAADQLLYAGDSGAIPGLLRLLPLPAGLPQATGLPQAAGLPRPGGLILLNPDTSDAQLPLDLAALPDMMPAAVIAAASPAAAQAAGDLFLGLAGEDASLFPGFRGTQALSPQTWLSVDGRRQLTLVPALIPLTAGWSPRLNHIVVQTAAQMLPEPSADPQALASRLAYSAAAVYGRTLLVLLALLLWLAALLLLILAQAARPAEADRPCAQQTRPASPATPARLPALLEILLYLPAAALAIPAGALLAGLSGNSSLTTGFRFYALLGFYGWLYLAALGTRRAGRIAGVRLLIPTLASALLGSVLLAVAAGWLSAANGRIVPLAEPGSLLPVLLPLGLLLLPAMLPFAQGRDDPHTRMPAGVALMHGILPALYLAGLRLAESAAALSGSALPNGGAAVSAGLPGAWPAALSGLALLLLARTVAKALASPSVQPFVPALAGLAALLLAQPFPAF